MSTVIQTSSLFSRNLRKNYPVAVSGEGCWIIAADGRRYLDASGQAAVVSIGHGVAEIGRAMAEQSGKIAFAHTTQFHSAAGRKAGGASVGHRPENFQNGGRVYFTSGGSEATETAIKLARQYFLESKAGLALSRDFAQAELPRQHAGGDVGERQCGAACAVRADDSGVGARSAVFLLSLPV